MRVAGQLPKHIYCWVDSAFTHENPQGFIRVLWFGLVSIPSRMWGCTVLLESGACYRNLPPHAIAFSQDAEKDWHPADAQRWDCYGEEFSAIEYEALKAAAVLARVCDGKPARDYRGRYLFSITPIGDGYSSTPEQSKEFTFVALENGRLTIQPTDRVLFLDKSFTTNETGEFSKGLRRQTEVYSCER